MATLSRPRLARMHDVLSGYVERGELPGLVALVARGGEVHIDAIGRQSFGESAPMRSDSIFRVASITKLVTAVAAMILVEECRLRLDDPVDRWLPELANRRVLRSIESELDDTVPAKRPITLRDLLTLTMGFGSVMAKSDSYPIQRAIRELRIGGDGPKLQTEWPPQDEWIASLGSLPLMAQPGERWMYHVSSDVLGVLISRVAGTSLGEFMHERIFEPLGMKDTSFRLPATADETSALQRLVTFYDDKLEVFDAVGDSTWLIDPPFESGGGGLLSTIDDFHAFCRMLLRKGDPILARASVELMTSDQVTPAQRAGAELFFGRHGSWGFGMQIDIARHDIFHNIGRFGWTGGFGTTAYTDPVEEMIAILFTQRLMASPEAPKVFVDFFTLAYAAIV